MDKDEARKELHKIDAEMIREEHFCNCKCNKKQKRKDKYKDILESIEMYVEWTLMSKEPNITVSEIKPLYDRVQQWLEEEV